MDKITYKDEYYDVIDTIMFSGTKHLIIKNESTTLFINKRDNKFYPAMKDLSLVNNMDIPLSYIRKQHLLWYLIEYINERNIIDEKSIKKLIKSFKEYIKSSNIERFLYWPLLNDNEFRLELLPILSDLEYQLNNSLIAKEDGFMDVSLVGLA